MDILSKLTHPIFNNFTLDELHYLLKITKLSVFEKNDILIHEGEINHEIYVIIDGLVRVSKLGDAPGEVISLATLGKESVLGEISVITNQPRSATVTALEETVTLVINVDAIQKDENLSLYKKLLQNLTAELSKKIIYANQKLQKIAQTDDYHAAEDEKIYSPKTILTPLGWKWRDIMLEVPFLAEHGYDAIKISPPQEFVVRMGNPWWEMYQPVSYFLSNFYGSEKDFAKMIDFCHSFNIKVYADLILNHMAECTETEPKHIGTNNHNFSKYHYSPLNAENDSYEFDDFYHFTEKGNLQVSNDDYCRLERVWHLEHYDLLNLPKLNMDNSHVLSILKKYASFLLSLGVDGFRIDAAKHLKIYAVEKLLMDLRTKDGDKPFIYQEYYTSIPMGIDVYSYMEKYFKVGHVTSFKYGEIIADALTQKNNNLQKLVEYSFGSSWIHYPENRAVVVIDNHDTERMMPNMLNYKCSQYNAYVLGYIFMLAWPFGIPKIMSSFRFSSHNDSIPTTPVWQNERNTCFDTGSPWVGQHRWNAIANMVLFRNKTKTAPGISHIWADGNQVAFARTLQKPNEYVTSLGFIVINATDKALKRRFETGLPAGKYYDIISSIITRGQMQGSTIEVENYGFSTIEVNPYDAAVIMLDYVAS